MNNNRKRYFHIDSGTSTGHIFASLDTVESNNEEQIDELMNDSDTEFTASKGIEVTDNPENASVLASEANVHVADERTTHTKELESNKMRKNAGETTPITWKRNVSSHSSQSCLLEDRVF